MPKQRPQLTTKITPHDRRDITQGLDKRAGKQRFHIAEWIAKKRQDDIQAGLYRKTIHGTEYIYRPLGNHLWERCSTDGRRRTLVKHLPEDLD